MSWLFFALLAPVLYASSSFIDKYMVEKQIKHYSTYVILGGFLAVPFSLLVFITQRVPPIIWQNAALMVVAGVLVELALLPYVKAILIDDVSQVTPAFQIIPVMVYAMSYVFLGERLSANELAGAALVLLGAYLVSVGRKGAYLFHLRKSSGWVLLASVMWATPSVILRYISGQYSYSTAVAYEYVGVALGAFALFFVPAFRRGFVLDIPAIKPSAWGIIIANEVLYLGAALVGYYAIAIAPALALASSLISTMPFFALVIGLVLSVWFPHIVKENIEKGTVFIKVVSIVFILAGVWFMNA